MLSARLAASTMAGAQPSRCFRYWTSPSQQLAAVQLRTSPAQALPWTLAEQPADAEGPGLQELRFGHG